MNLFHVHYFGSPVPVIVPYIFSHLLTLIFFSILHVLNMNVFTSKSVLPIHNQSKAWY
jgi:hypothetical protein